jgi:hypothetical protein
MPSLRAGVVKLATTVSARGKRKAGDNNDEHHRDQQDRRQQNGGHRIDSTPDTTVVTGLERVPWILPGGCGRPSSCSIVMI